MLSQRQLDELSKATPLTLPLSEEDLAALIAEAEDLDLPSLDGLMDQLADQLSTIAAETGMDRELDYNAELHMEAYLEAAWEKRDAKV